MCGIVGVITGKQGGVTYQNISIFEDLLYIGKLRGPHGTGAYYSMGNGERTAHMKMGTTPEVFLNTKQYDKFIDNPKKKSVPFLVGHNRWATKGGPSSKNSHPFTKEHITMVHNGTLSSIYGFKEFKDHEVDSEAFTSAIAKMGIDKTIDDVYGAYSIVYYNAKEKTLNFLRNEERPMWFAIGEHEDTIYFASELAMLQWILFREKEFNFKAKELPVGELWTFPVFSNVLKQRVIPVRRACRKVYNYNNNYPRNVNYATNTGASNDATDEAGQAILDAYAAGEESPTLATPADTRRSLPALLSPPTSSPQKATTKSKDRQSYIIDKYLGRVKGNHIIFGPTTFQDQGQGRWLIEGQRKDMVKTTFIGSYIGDEADLELVINNQNGAKGRIVNMVMKISGGKDQEVLIYVADLAPNFETLTEEEDKQIYA